MKSTTLHALIIASFFAASAWAADTPSPPPPEKKDLILEQARGAIEQKDWLRAQGLLRDAVAKNPQNADAHNLYAYATRMGPNPEMATVFRHYNEALRIDPQHRGAHEYLGQAYLLSGNVAKAKEHLAQLDRLCSRSCEESSRLRKAIATAEAKR
jgi:cytochrome c-type biogenesis protein CcmH/NrfG